MFESKQVYKVMCDGFLVTQITLPMHSTKEARDTARKAVAIEYGVPMHYLRLRPTQIICKEMSVNVRQ